MMLSPIAAIVQGEVRIRSRRLSTMVVLLAIIGISWLMVPDPKSGMTMMAINDARVIYDSQCLAMAGSTLMGTLLSLCGFYLVRGRMRADLVFGVGAPMAAAAIGNLQFLLGRWLGAVAYLFSMAALCMASLVVLHAIHGESAILLHVYLEYFLLIITPEIVFVASMSILFDAFAPLMGKVGDVVFFLLWAITLGLSGTAGGHATSSLPLALWSDFSGVGTVIYGLHHLVHTTNVSIGVASFNASLAPVVMAGQFWTRQMMLMRFLCCLVAALPLAVALPLFHRFSPDRIKPGVFRARRSLWAMANTLVTPVGRLARPLYAGAIRGTGLCSGVLADMALLVSCNPISIVVVAIALLAGATVPASMLPAVLTGAVALWGILISDSAVRDCSCGIEPMTGYLPGGPVRRYMRQLLACWSFGLLMVLPIALRWLVSTPLRCMSLVTGLFALSAIANLFGRITHTSRTFTALWLFAIYVSIQASHVPAFDTVGILGVATAASVLAVTLSGCIAVLASLLLTPAERLAAV
jgi:hypothetical protein